jgi:hypothetical protein
LMSSLCFFTWILPTVHLDNDFLTVEAPSGIQNEFKVMGLTSHEYPTGPWAIYLLETIFHQKHSLVWLLKTSLIKPGVDNKLKEGLEPRCSTVCKGNRWAWRPERGCFSSGSGMSVFSFSNIILAIFQFFFVSHIFVERVIWPPNVLPEIASVFWLVVAFYLNIQSVSRRCSSEFMANLSLGYKIPSVNCGSLFPG